MAAPLDDAVLDQLFRDAHSTHSFLPREVGDDVIEKLYSLLKFGPTAFNSQPARYVFIRSTQAKERLKPALSSGNRDKTLAAPATVIVAYDTRFFDYLPEQFPAYDAKKLYEASPELVEPNAFRNSTLQGAYLILAARALGLAVGPMSGFNAERLNAEFFPSGRYKANFIANLGYAAPDPNYRRGPRLPFEEAVQIL